MRVTCPQCGYQKTISAAAIPVAAVSATCPRCRCRFGIERNVTERVSTDAGAPAQAPGSAVFTLKRVEDDGCDDSGSEGNVSFINILALLLIIDSTLWLLAHFPDLPQLLKGTSGIPFPQRVKSLYDTGSSIGVFISAFGLLARKGWARIGTTLLLGLSLAEGLFMLVNNYGALNDLEKSGVSVNGIGKSQPALLLGCVLYGYFLIKLNSSEMKSRFSTFSPSDVATRVRKPLLPTRSTSGDDTAQRIGATRGRTTTAPRETSAFVSAASVVSLGTGYLLFALSLCRPSLVVGWLDGNDTILGFHALLASPFFAVATLMRGSGSILSIFHILLGLLLPICNLFVLGSYWLYRYYKKSLDETLLLGAVVFAAAAWSYPAKAEDFPPIGGDGYYLWAASITFIAGAFLLRRVAAR